MKRDEYKDLPKGYYHLSTDGKWDGIIFHTPARLLERWVFRNTL